MQKRYLTKEECKEIAFKWGTRTKLDKGDKSVYRRCVENGWLDEFFGPSRKSPETNWTYDTLKSESIKYNSRNAFKWGNWNAYHAARRKSYFEELCQHMKSSLGTVGDVLYVLKVPDFTGRSSLLKFGITSKKCGTRRLQELKSTSKLNLEVLHWIETVDARLLEKELLGLGYKVALPVFGGYKEFRMVNQQNLEKVNTILNQYYGRN